MQQDKKDKKEKNSENIFQLEIIEVPLFYYNLVKNNYKNNSRVLYKQTHTKLIIWIVIGDFMNILIFSIAINSESLYNKVWLTDQNYQPL